MNKNNEVLYIAPESISNAVSRARATLLSLHLPIKEGDLEYQFLAGELDLECWDHLCPNHLELFFEGLTEAIDALSQARNRFAFKMMQRVIKSEEQ